MIGPDITPTEADFVLRAVEDKVFSQKSNVRPALNLGALMAKLVELKKQARALQEGRRRYLEVLHAEDATFGR